MILRGSASCWSVMVVTYSVACRLVVIAATFRVLRRESPSSSYRIPSLLRILLIMRSLGDVSLMLLASDASGS